MRCLSDFVEAQMAFYAQCQRHMLELQKDLRALNMNVSCGNGSAEGGKVCAFQNVFEGGVSSAPIEKPNNNSSYRKAKVLYAYEALGNTELTVQQNEVWISAETTLHCTSLSALDSSLRNSDIFSLN